MGITLFLISMWGRAVVSDTELIADAAEAAGRSDIVAARVETWFTQEMVELGLGDASAPLAGEIVELPEVESAMATMVREVVYAGSGVSDTTTSVDVATIFMPAVPAITDSLTEAGLPVDESQVASVVAGLDPIVVRAGGGPAIVGPESNPARSLTLASILSLSLMLVAGAGATYLVEDRRAMIRSLFTRVAVSAMTFAVIFRVGAWALDPGGGRVSVAGGAAELVGAKLWLPVVIALAAGSGAWLFYRRTGRLKPRA